MTLRVWYLATGALAWAIWIYLWVALAMSHVVRHCLWVMPSTQSPARINPTPAAVHHYSLKCAYTEDGGEDVYICDPCATKHMPAVDGDLVTATAAEPGNFCDECQPERLRN